MYILTDARSAKEHEISIDSNVGHALIDKSAKAYISLTARATLFSNSAKANELWHVWNGWADQNLVIIRANLLVGEIWDGPALFAVL